MKKNIISIAVIITLLLVVFGLSACYSQPIEKYKVEKKAEIQAFADSRGQVNYSYTNWGTICEYVEACKNAVDLAKTKVAVDTAITTAMEKIEAVEIEMKESIQFNELPVSFSVGSDKNLSTIIKSTNELSKLLADTPWLASEYWNNFDTEFFNNKALILYSTTIPNACESYVLEDIQAGEDNLKLCLVGQYYGDTMNDVLGYVPLVVAVDKRDIGKISIVYSSIRYERLG